MKETKTETVALRLSPEEKEFIQKQAKDADMTVSKYLHRVIFGKEDQEERKL